MKGASSSENPLSPEILKLIEKLTKDPKSRLFVSLAEEYLRIGMLEEAHMVLTDGLKIHPRFGSAKTTLGKVYLEMGKINEARAQFEEILRENPENLLAHRKLARIYRNAREFEKAKSSCQVVLNLNPKDPEMKQVMEELTELTKDLAEPGSMVQSESFEPREASEEAYDPVVGIRDEPQGSSSSEVQREESAGSPPLVSSVPESVEADRLSAPSESMESESSSSQDSYKPDQESIAEPISLNSLSDDAGGEGETQEWMNLDAVQPEAMESPLHEGTTDGESASDSVAGDGDELATESLADLYIEQGYYDKGKAIYEKLLVDDPGNSGIQRKIEQTDTLINLFSNDSDDEAGERGSDMISNKTETVSHSADGEDGQASRKKQKIRRLEAWLDSLRKGMKQ